METNMIDRCLAKVEAGNVVKRYICEELLFFYTLWEKKKHTSGWFKGAFGRKRENVWFLFKICSSSYVANSQDNLFQIFNDWKYKEALRNFRRTELSFLCEPYPVKLGGYICSNPCIYGAKFKWDEADLDFSWASLETIVKVIETSEMLSAYAAMIKICVQKFTEDDDYFNTKHPVPSECFIGSTVGFWDM